MVVLTRAMTRASSAPWVRPVVDSAPEEDRTVAEGELLKKKNSSSSSAPTRKRKRGRTALSASKQKNKKKKSSSSSVGSSSRVGMERSCGSEVSAEEKEQETTVKKKKKNTKEEEVNTHTLLRPKRKTKAIRERMKQWFQRVKETEGFDVPPPPHRTFFNMVTIPSEHLDYPRYVQRAKWALGKQKKQGLNLELIKIVKCVTQHVQGILYFFTIEARNIDTNEVEIYQAKVWDNIGKFILRIFRKAAP